MCGGTDQLLAAVRELGLEFGQDGGVPGGVLEAVVWAGRNCEYTDMFINQSFLVLAGTLAQNIANYTEICL